MEKNMEVNKDNKKISNISHKKSVLCNIKRYNSPLFSRNRIKSYLLENEKQNENKNKKSDEFKKENSTNNIKYFKKKI